jgi:hypothetical protein
VSEDGKYFQGPLCTFAFPEDFKQQVDHFICYSTVEAGYRAMRKDNDREWWKMKAETIWKEKGKPTGFDREREDHIAVLVGADLLNVGPGCISAMAQSWAELRKFKTDFEREHRDRTTDKVTNDALVRVEHKLTFEARNGSGITEREFRTLVAIYSVIGRKPYAWVTRATIRRRMLGYRTEAILNKCMGKTKPKRKDGAEPLELHQINYTVDRLHQLRFFARARANKRQTYYSHRLTQSELEAALIKSKTYSSEFTAERIQRDATLMETIKAKRAAIIVKTPIIVKTSEEKADSTDVQSVPSAASQHPSQDSSLSLHLNINSSIETLPIQTLPIETQKIERARAPISSFGKGAADTAAQIGADAPKPLDIAALFAQARKDIADAPEPQRRRQ